MVMRRFRSFLATSCIAVLAVMGALPARAADATANFYKGKTVQVLIGFSAGGGYDIYARTLARYMGKHLPGNPTMVPQNIPGAGTLKVANYIYNVAPKDGTVIGTFARGIPMEKLLGRTVGQQFDATKFTWIGSVTDEPSVRHGRTLRVRVLGSLGHQDLAGYEDQTLESRRLGRNI
jgi:tripartite-type tricarboxylate transporter receptor subunit TctC